MGHPPEFFIGRSVYELEEQKYPSIAKSVIERKEKISSIQVTKYGRRLFSTGNPVFDDEGNLIRIINTARDITETTILKEELEFYKNSVSKYEQELVRLKKKQTPYEQQVKKQKRFTLYSIGLRPFSRFW